MAINLHFYAEQYNFSKRENVIADLFREFENSLSQIESASRTRSGVPVEVHVARAAVDANYHLSRYMENFVPTFEVLKGWQYILVVRESLNN